MTTLNTTPRADGFRMPAEWETHSQTWMVWPERPDNWRNGGKPAQAFLRHTQHLREAAEQQCHGRERQRKAQGNEQWACAAR